MNTKIVQKQIQFNEIDIEENGRISGTAMVLDNLDNDGDKFAKDVKITYGELGGLYDVFMYASHDPSLPYAKTGNKSLRFERKEGKVNFEAFLNLEIQRDKDLFLMIKEERINGVSAGFRVHKMKEISTGYEFLEIELQEISMTHRPADQSTVVKEISKVKKETVDDRLKKLGVL